MEVGRWLQKERLQESADANQHRVEPGIDLGVPLREFGDLFEIPIVAVQGHRPAVGERNEERRLLPHDPVSVPREIEALHHLRQQKGADVGGRGDLVAGEQLFGDAGSAHDAARLEHGHAMPGLRDQVGGDEAVVARSDDDDVAACGHVISFPSGGPRILRGRGGSASPCVLTPPPSGRSRMTRCPRPGTP
jgi:hypothetical protein